jgi:hypothetical protein
MAHVPNYALDPLEAFLAYIRDSDRLLHVSMRGISALRGMPRIIEVLTEVRSGDEPRSEKDGSSLEQATADAAFAEKECEAGFPLLHAHTLVGDWGAFEAAIEDMVVGLLLNEPELLQGDALAKVRIPLAEFEALEKDERMRLLISELERNQGIGRKQGVDSFEALLERVGLSGSVDAEIRKVVWEMHHVRNVIVHRGSLADRRLVKNCPWMGLKVADKVVVTHESLGRYTEGLCSYVLALVYRLGARYGVDIKSRLRDVQPEADQSAS